MKIIERGLDMREHVVDLTCGLCLTKYAASADPKANEALVYDAGEVPKPGQTRQLRAVCNCPNCGTQNNECVDLRKV